MYSPTKDDYKVRIGDNKKIYIIKGRRKIKKDKHYNAPSISK
jgi:hypothetical protein